MKSKHYTPALLLLMAFANCNSQEEFDAGYLSLQKTIDLPDVGGRTPQSQSNRSIKNL